MAPSTSIYDSSGLDTGVRRRRRDAIDNAPPRNVVREVSVVFDSVAIRWRWICCSVVESSLGDEEQEIIVGVRAVDCLLPRVSTAMLNRGSF